MTEETQDIEKKSLRLISGRKSRWPEVVREVVAFANARGGKLLIGIEDGKSEPPAGQAVPSDLPERVRRRVGELTVNVDCVVRLQRFRTTGGEYLEIEVFRSHSPASTTDGRFFLRISDASQPLTGENVQRLLNERIALPWETLTPIDVPREEVDSQKLAEFAAAIRDSDRVKPSVREKSDPELLDHYSLAKGPILTNLGVLCLGRREDRVRLGTAPIIQFIKYDVDERKTNKIAWDDYSLSPIELVEAVWRGIPDFRESFELPDGLFRRQIPMYDRKVVRELLVNALVHRPYTQQGDIYLNLHPDRLEIVNPGRLPLGVTPENILHQSVRRNHELARLFHDLELMEREGSGYDLLYEVLLSQGRPLPVIREGSDWVSVVIQRRIMKPEVIDFLERADQMFSLRQREKITLGLLAQHEGLTARDLARLLELEDASGVARWMGRLPKWGLVRQTGRTKGARYFVDPELLRKLEFPSRTTLARIEPHRLRSLILEDLERNPGSSFGEIHQRIGDEIPDHQVRKQIKTLVEKERIAYQGEFRWRRYWVSGSAI